MRRKSMKGGGGGTVAEVSKAANYEENRRKLKEPGFVICPFFEFKPFKTNGLRQSNEIQ